MDVPILIASQLEYTAMQLGALGGKHRSSSSAGAELESARAGLQESGEDGERGGEGEGRDVVEEGERAGRRGRGGEGSDHGAEEGRGEDVGRSGEDEGQGRTGGGREAREESREEDGVEEEAELGEERVKLVSGGGCPPAGQAAKEAEDGGRGVRVGWRRRLHELAVSTAGGPEDYYIALLPSRDMARPEIQANAGFSSLSEGKGRPSSNETRPSRPKPSAFCLAASSLPSPLLPPSSTTPT